MHAVDAHSMCFLLDDCLLLYQDKTTGIQKGFFLWIFYAFR